MSFFPAPASPESFVWLRLYLADLGAPLDPNDPIWWTLRRRISDRLFISDRPRRPRTEPGDEGGFLTRWLARAVHSGARVIGVNNRNLRTLTVDVEASYRLASQIPANVVAVSESGLQSRADLEKLSAAGYRAFLIGERFMTDGDPAAAIRDLLSSDVGKSLRCS